MDRHGERGCFVYPGPLPGAGLSALGHWCYAVGDVIPWETLDTVDTLGGKMTLRRRGRDYVITVNGHELMSNRAPGSEEALATLGCAHLRDVRKARVLIGGLGMGFTLAAALRVLPEDAHVRVVERVNAVFRWYRAYFDEALQHRAWFDPRVSVTEGGVAAVMYRHQRSYHAILLDVDNGPTPLSSLDNADLYNPAGLRLATRSLRVGGVLAVWSAGEDPAFTHRLTAAGLAVSVHRVRESPGSRRQNVVWVARRVSADEPCGSGRNP